MSEQSQELEIRLREQVHRYEEMALRTRRTSLLLRLVHLVCLASVPTLIFATPERSFMTTIAGILAMISVIASTFLQAFRFDARWEQTVSAIRELNKLRFEIETRRVESPEELLKEVAKAAEVTAKVEAALMYPGSQN